MISFAVDLTTDAASEIQLGEDSPLDAPSRDEPSNLNDEERGLLQRRNGKVPRSARSSNGHSDASRTEVQEETEMETRPSSVMTDSSAFVKRKTSQFLNAIRGSKPAGSTPMTPRVAAIVEAYASSDIAADIRAEIDSFAHRNPAEELPNVAEEERLLRGRKGASWLMQFRILSGRAFKNLYRDPALLAAHYLSSIGLACECTLS